MTNIILVNNQNNIIENDLNYFVYCGKIYPMTTRSNTPTGTLYKRSSQNYIFGCIFEIFVSFLVGVKIGYVPG